MKRDAWFAWRALRTNARFSVTTVIVLALAIGANTAIFSVVHTLLFKPLPYANANRLVAVFTESTSARSSEFWSYPKFSAFQRQQQALAATAAYGPWTVQASSGSQALELNSEIISEKYLETLGVAPAYGRAFTEQEHQGSGIDAVILSDRLWRELTARDPEILSQHLTIKYRPFRIVGVMPASFRGQSGATELWIPLAMAPTILFKEVLSEPQGLRQSWLRVFGVLAPGVGIEAAIESFKSISIPNLDGQASRSGSLHLEPLKSTKVDPNVSRAFGLLMSVVVVVLVAGCFNTAVLILSRMSARRLDFSIRLSLGASRASLVRQVAIEALTLSGIGAVLALLVAFAGMEALANAKPWNSVGFWSQYALTFDYFKIEFDWSLLGFNFLIAIVAAVLVAVIPAWHAARLDPNAVLRDGIAGGVRFPSQDRPPLIGNCLLVAEISMSVVLLVCSGLAVRSLIQLTSVDQGFESTDITTATLSGAERRAEAYYHALLYGVEQIPSIDSAALSSRSPLGGASPESVRVSESAGSAQRAVPAVMNIVTPGFFRTYGVSVLEGRGFNDADDVSAPRVAVVSQSMAAAWPGQNAIGQRIWTPYRITYGDPDASFEVIGIAGNANFGTIEAPVTDVVYLPAWQPLGSRQAVTRAPDIVSVRTRVALATVSAQLRRQIEALSPNVPVREIATMGQRIARLTSRYRYTTAMIAGFAILTFLLTVVGLYSVVVWAVNARLREVAIRIAIGARASDVVSLVVRGVALSTVLGIALGLIGARVASRSLGAMLFHVQPGDLPTFVAIGLGVGLIAMVACVFPLRRATRADAASLLRSE